MAEQNTEKGTLTEKPDDMSFADWKKYRSSVQSKPATAPPARGASSSSGAAAGRNFVKSEQRNNNHNNSNNNNRSRPRITDYDPRNNMQMAPPPFPPFRQFQPPFPFFQPAPPPPPWGFNSFSDDFGPPNFFNNRQKFGPRDDFFIGNCAPSMPPPLRNPRNPFNAHQQPGFDQQMMPNVHPKKFFKKEVPGGPVRPGAKKKFEKKKAKQAQNAKTGNNNNNDMANAPKIEGSVMVNRQPELYIHASTNGGPPGWVRKPPPPPPLEEGDTGEVLEEKQRMWKEYRQAMKPFKHRDFANAKRTIQRFGKRTDLDEKELSRLQRAQEFVAGHKAMLTQKAAQRQNMGNPEIALIPGTVVPNDTKPRQAPPPPPPPPQPTGGIHWVRQQDIEDNPTIRGGVVETPRKVEPVPPPSDPLRPDCVIEIPETPQQIKTVTTTNSHQSAWHLRQELTKLESLVDMAEFTGS